MSRTEATGSQCMMSSSWYQIGPNLSPKGLYQLTFSPHTNFLCIYLQHKATSYCFHACFYSICLQRFYFPGLYCPTLSLISFLVLSTHSVVIRESHSQIKLGNCRLVKFFIAGLLRDLNMFIMGYKSGMH